MPLTDFMNYYDVTLMNPKVLSESSSVRLLAFVFCGLTMNAVGRAAQKMVNEVRRQFEIPNQRNMTGEGEPDCAKCVDSRKGPQHEMVFPSLLAIIIPVVMGLIFGVSGVIGLLAGDQYRVRTGYFHGKSRWSWDMLKSIEEVATLVVKVLIIIKQRLSATPW